MRRPVVVLDVDPVPHVAAVAHQRHLPAVEQVGGEEGDQLLGELVRPVVVGAPRHHDGQAVGGVVAEGDEVGSRLGGRVGRTRRQDVGLGVGALVDRAVHLVGGDVQEAADPEAVGDVAQHVGAEGVGVHEREGVGDGAVDVALGGEVDDGVVAGHVLEGGVLVADVGLHEPAPAIVDQVAEVLDVAGVGQLVVDGDLVVAVGQHPTDVVGADEPGRAGDEQLHDLSRGPAGPVSAARRTIPVLPRLDSLRRGSRQRPTARRQRVALPTEIAVTCAP